MTLARWPETRPTTARTTAWVCPLVSTVACLAAQFPYMTHHADDVAAAIGYVGALLILPCVAYLAIAVILERLQSRRLPSLPWLAPLLFAQLIPTGAYVLMG